jgi:hypothetical protein
MTDETKKTVVELIFQEMLEIQQSGKTLTFDENLLLLEKYKEMEKDQHIKSWEAGLMKVDFNEYYNETYGGNQ